MTSSDAALRRRGTSKNSAALTLWLFLASALEQKSAAFSIRQQQRPRSYNRQLPRRTGDVEVHPPLPVDTTRPIISSQSRLVDLPGQETSTVPGHGGEEPSNDDEPDFNINVGRGGSFFFSLLS